MVKKSEAKEEQAKPAESKKFWTKGKIIISSVLVVFIFLIGIAYYFSLPTPTGEVVLNDKNSEIYSLLVAGGINESMVDATAERVFIAYDLPDGMEKEASWYFAMGAAAAASPDSEKVVVQAFVNDKATERISVKIKDVLDLLSRKITDSEFSGKVEIGS